MSEDPARPHDVNGFLNPFLKKVLLCGFGTDLGGKLFVETGERLEKNCAENEPFFIVTALLAGLTGAVPAGVGTALVSTYAASRCFHTAVFVMGDKFNASYRSGAYVISLTCTLALSAFGLKGFR
jgi:uncharacterized MAPEG superfamily protein